MGGRTCRRNSNKSKITLSENNIMIGKRQYKTLNCYDCNFIGKNIFCIYGEPYMQGDVIVCVNNTSKPFMACAQCGRRTGVRVRIVCDLCEKERVKGECDCSVRSSGTLLNVTGVYDASFSLNEYGYNGSKTLELVQNGMQYKNEGRETMKNIGNQRTIIKNEKTDENSESVTNSNSCDDKQKEKNTQAFDYDSYEKQHPYNNLDKYWKKIRYSL